VVLKGVWCPSGAWWQGAEGAPSSCCMSHGPCMTASRLALVQDGGWTPLLVASEKGQVPVVRALLARGVPLNCVTSTAKATPLLLAVEKGQAEVVQILLAHGADVNVARVCFWNCAGARGSPSRVESCDALHPRTVDCAIAYPPSSLCVWGGGRAVVGVLGTQVDGWTSLLIASEKGFLPIVQALLDNGADVRVARVGAHLPSALLPPSYSSAGLAPRCSRPLTP
jgi:ankyrin repeat protein